MNKKTRNILSTSIAFGTALSVGLVLGFTISDQLKYSSEENKIILHTADNVNEIEEETIDAFEKYISSQNSKSSIDLMDNSGDVTPPDDGGDSSGDGDSLEDNPNSTDAIVAKWLETGFYYISLTGHLPKDKGGIIKDENGNEMNPGGYKDKSILKKYIKGEMINDFNYIYRSLVEIKIYKETIASDVYLYTYMHDIAKEDPEMTNIVKPFTDVQYETLWDVHDEIWKKDGSGVNNKFLLDDYDDLLDALGNKLNYQLLTTKMIYSYAYLWQEHYLTTFDYFFTEYLAKSKYMIAWTMDAKHIQEGLERKYLDNVWNDSTNKPYLFKDNQVSDWNKKIEGNVGKDAYLSVESTNKKDANGHYGYEGFVTSDSIGLTGINEFGEYDSFYEFQNGDNITKQTEIGKITTKNMKLALDNKEHVIIETDTANRSGKVVVYKELYPFIFAKDYDINDEKADSYSYQLTAYEEGDLLYKEDNNNQTRTEISFFKNLNNKNLDSEWITGNDGTDVINRKNFFGTIGMNDADHNSNAIQLWLFDSVFSTNSDNILQKAQKYFRKEGYYLELKGKYVDDYQSLIPLWIQK